MYLCLLAEKMMKMPHIVKIIDWWTIKKLFTHVIKPVLFCGEIVKCEQNTGWVKFQETNENLNKTSVSMNFLI